MGKSRDGLVGEIVTGTADNPFFGCVRPAGSSRHGFKQAQFRAGTVSSRHGFKQAQSHGDAEAAIDWPYGQDAIMAAEAWREAPDSGRQRGRDAEEAAVGAVPAHGEGQLICCWAGLYRDQQHPAGQGRGRGEAAA
jgi:hypothetical protein